MNAPPDIAASLAVSLGQSAAGLVAAYLHGSEADGRGHRESDVDVGVLLDRVAYPTRESRFEARLRLIHQLGVAMGREVDVLVLNDVPPQLARRVLTQGRQVFLQGPEEHHAFLRTTLSRAADLEPFLRRTRQVKLAALAR